MNILFVALITAIGMAVATESPAQDKQKISFKALGTNSKYTQQHIIDVGDVPGHQIRIFELHRTYPTNPPTFDGVKVVESWTRVASDYTDLSGRNGGYTIFVLESGDKIFARQDGIAHRPEAGKPSAFTTVTFTGGTGRFQGIRGVLRTSAVADYRVGMNETQYDGEYWIQK